MYSFLKKLYYKNRLFNIVLYLPKYFFDIFLFRILPDQIYLRYMYYKYHLKNINFKNPKTLNEKIQWLKLYDRTPLHKICADKIDVRTYVKDCIGKEYLIPVEYVISDINKIDDINKISSHPVIIKCSHSSGNNFIIYYDEMLLDPALKTSLKTSLKYNHYYKTKEWQYKELKPRLIIEKLLLDNTNNIPNDYKCHCFNGKVAFIQVDINRHTNHKRNFYDTNWVLQNFVWSPHINGKPIWTNYYGVVEKPRLLSEMIEIAESLSSPFTYVRVDLYNLNLKIYFGELTFHPGSGIEKIFPYKYDKKFGEKLILSNLNIS